LGSDHPWAFDWAALNSDSPCRITTRTCRLKQQCDTGRAPSPEARHVSFVDIRTLRWALGRNKENSGIVPAGGALARASVPMAQAHSSGVCVAASSVICVVRASCTVQHAEWQYNISMNAESAEVIHHSSRLHLPGFEVRLAHLSGSRHPHPWDKSAATSEGATLNNNGDVSSASIFTVLVLMKVQLREQLLLFLVRYQVLPRPDVRKRRKMKQLHTILVF
jgi:hypothetical protein